MSSSTKSDIIASLFSRRSAEDGELDEAYVAHVKIFEEEPGEGLVKARYLMLAVARSGRYLLHKAKRNSNGTFSKGKTWALEDLQGLEVADASHFTLTFSRPYKYTTDRPQEQASFLEVLTRSRPDAAAAPAAPTAPAAPAASAARIAPVTPATPAALAAPRAPVALAAPAAPAALAVPAAPAVHVVPAIPATPAAPAVPSALATNSFEAADGVGTSRDEGEEDQILANVEEMLDGWDWSAVMGIGGASGDGASNLNGLEGLFGLRGVGSLGKGKGKDWEMEKRLADELSALQGANIHSLLETDERLVNVLDSIDSVIAQLDTIDAKIATYKIQLHAVSDDISYIESQNRGLQVQTSNQKALLAELENLLTIVQVDNEDLMTLTQESPGSDKGIVALESAAASLYKALQAIKETSIGDMQAAMERSGEYESYNAQFCQRLSDYLAIMIKFQSDELLATAAQVGGIPTMQSHDKLEASLIKYSGLVLYMKEMDEPRYQKLAATYFGIVSELQRKEIKALLLAYIARLKKSVEEDAAELFISGGAGPSLTPAPKGAVAIARSKTVSAFKNPLDGAGKKDKKSDSEMRISEAFERAFTPVVSAIYREESLIADFLHINNQDGSTFADYMGLEPYVRRQASRLAARGVSQPVQQLMRSSMDLIFGFLAPELKAWIDGALQRDMMQIVGVMAACERFLADAEHRSEAFVINLFQKQLQRLNAQLEQFVSKIIRAIESTKLTVKKRKGVAPFVKHFPVFIDTFEGQLGGTDGLQIRKIVDGSYERIASIIFDSLQQMAKMDGADGVAAEDKGQLNYHVILIENMHYLVGELAKQNPATFSGLSFRAQGIYRESLTAYMRLVLRKPLGRLMDFFEGIERILHSGAASPAEVPNQAGSSKAALKRIIKEHDAKDVRKAIEGIYKRIDKHFDLASAGDNPTLAGSGSSSSALIEVVADEVQGELSALTEKWASLIGRCYPDSSLALEFTTSDITSAFARAKTGL